MPDLKPPIFLLGNVRSGTSMMYDIFDHHPDVVGWYEPRTVWTYAAPGRRHDRFTGDDATPRVIRYIRKRIAKYQQAAGGRRVMEKTPSNIMRIPYVRTIFPESRYIYMVREPLANLSSSELRWQKSINRKQTVKRLRETPKSQLHYHVGRLIYDKARKMAGSKYVSIWGVRYPGIQDDLEKMTVEEVIARQWVRCSQQAEQDLSDVDSELVIRIRYEDFVADPVNQFRRIATHFNLDVPDELAHYIDGKVDPTRQSKWRRLDRSVLDACLPILEREMARHSYTVPDELRADNDSATEAAVSRESE